MSRHEVRRVLADPGVAVDRFVTHVSDAGSVSYESLIDWQARALEAAGLLVNALTSPSSETCEGVGDRAIPAHDATAGHVAQEGRTTLGPDGSPRPIPSRTPADGDAA